MFITLSRPLAIIDLETTGINTRTDRIIEICVSRIDTNGDKDTKTRRLNPTIPIPPEATAIHGISDQDVLDKPTFAQIGKSLLQFIEGCDLCGYNIKNFDLSLLAYEFARIGLPFSTDNRSIIDPMQIFKLKEPRNLNAACQFYLGRPHAHAHNAEEDTTACISILEAQIMRYNMPNNSTEIAMMFNEGKIDIDGFFCNTTEGVAFARGKYKGTLVSKCDKTYLEWILEQNFLPDAKEIAKTFLKQK